MILYDQDFNFIGMSAETLAFLGYEDIDEFTSMHSDFADLFVKKEGFIHKFENFSWIHYILYSGAANKKAYVLQKNGDEAPVDITIKEVFLNHTYDGLRKIYSVKLINENFTKISKTDVHDNRSKKSSEFSLRNLTGEALDITHAPQSAETESPAPAPSMPESVDFKLDMPEIPERDKAQPHAQPDVKPQNETNDFVLNLPPLDEKPEIAPLHDAEATIPAHLNLDQDLTIEEPALQISEPDTSDIFKLDISATPEPVSEENTAEESIAPRQEEEEEHIPHISFGSVQSDSSEKKHTDMELFSFDLLKKEEKPEPAEEQHASLSEPQEINKTEISSSAKEVEQEGKAFSFDLFKKVASSEKEETPREPEAMAIVSDQNRDALIDQIKNDIAEIDSETPADLSEQNEAAMKLEQILAESRHENASESREEPPAPETTIKIEMTDQESDLTDKLQQHPQQAESESAEQTLFSRPQKSDQEHSFEKTLQDVFQIPASSQTSDSKRVGEENSEQELNHLNLLKDEEANQQSITKESLESQELDSEGDNEALKLPQLGTLGLDHDEELDFIEEFLEDTKASLGLIEEYLKLEDYDNIKYSLIKISSSAEILHFEQILEHARSMAEQCDKKAYDALQQELEKLRKTVARYKEHYATIVA